MNTEQVLVVDRQALEARLRGQVFLTDGLEAVRQFLLDHHTFLPRQQAEYDTTVRQIIPYGILRRGGKYFLLRRLKGQTEARLHHKLSLGLGGHINPSEEDAADPIEAGLRRELAEEVDLPRLTSLTCVGLINETTGGGERLPHRPGLPAGDRRGGGRPGDREDGRPLGRSRGTGGGFPRPGDLVPDRGAGAHPPWDCVMCTSLLPFFWEVFSPLPAKKGLQISPGHDTMIKLFETASGCGEVWYRA